MDIWYTPEVMQKLKMHFRCNEDHEIYKCLHIDRILGEGGGYILAPRHAIQPVSPIENVLALYDTGYEYGWT